MHMRVDANYDGSLLWQNYVFPLGTFYSNAYGDNISLNPLNDT
jgi:hypothetical protein